MSLEEWLLGFAFGWIAWDIYKRLRPKRKISSGGGMRVTFSATVPTFEEGQYLLDHILKIRHPQNGSYVMYDVDFKIDR